jgi:hypothetical protein
MAKQKFTKEGYPILEEYKLKGGGTARVIDYPQPVIPEPDEEEKWYMNLDDVFRIGEELDEDIFQYENFYPEKCGKDVGSGAWIMVKTDIGYNVYFAKKSKKYFDSNATKRKIKRLQAKEEASYDLDMKLENLGGIIELNGQLRTANQIEMLGEEPKYVKIQKTRTQVRYLLPHEYKIIDDIQLYVDAVTDGKSRRAVKFKALFTAKQNDAIFYMQQRGIRKEIAEMMVQLQNGYFICDTQAMFSDVYQLVE